MTCDPDDLSFSTTASGNNKIANLTDDDIRLILRIMAAMREEIDVERLQGEVSQRRHGHDAAVSKLPSGEQECVGQSEQGTEGAACGRLLGNRHACDDEGISCHSATTGYAGDDRARSFVRHTPAAPTGLFHRHDDTRRLLLSVLALFFFALLYKSEDISSIMNWSDGSCPAPTSDIDAIIEERLDRIHDLLGKKMEELARSVGRIEEAAHAQRSFDEAVTSAVRTSTSDILVGMEGVSQNITAAVKTEIETLLETRWDRMHDSLVRKMETLASSIVSRVERAHAQSIEAATALQDATTAMTSRIEGVSLSISAMKDDVARQRNYGFIRINHGGKGCMDTDFKDFTIYIRDCHHSRSDQKWYWDQSTTRIMNGHSGKCVEYDYSKTDGGGTNLYMNTCHGENNQKWNLDRNGRIRSTYDGGKCIEMNAALKSLSVHPCRDDRNQQFSFALVV